LVEQRTENPRVAGSIPALGIFYFLFFAHGWLEKAWAFFIFYYLFSFFAHGWLEKA
jgi:hypothetical protein